MPLDTILVGILLILPVLNWYVAASLIRLSIISPPIKALTERTLLAVLIAVVTTVYSLVVVNTITGLSFWDAATVRSVIRLLIIGIGIYPLWWAWTYSTGHFEDGHFDAGHFEDESWTADSDGDDAAGERSQSGEGT